jgi:cytochrome P450
MTALMEMRLVMEELLARIPDIELVAPEKVEWEFHGAETQGFLELPAQFTARPRRDS